MVTKLKLKKFVKDFIAQEIGGIRCNIVCENADNSLGLQSDKDWMNCESICDKLTVKILRSF